MPQQKCTNFQKNKFCLVANKCQLKFGVHLIRDGAFGILDGVFGVWDCVCGICCL